LLFSHRLLLSALFACAALVGPARADTENETFTEVDGYFKLSDRFRLFTSASLTKSLNEGATDSDLGLYLDVLALRPIFGGRLIDADVARNRYVWGRIGFAFGGAHEGTDLNVGYKERQFVFELYGRYPISEGFWVESRARFDERTLSGARANRYRVRLGLDKQYTVLGKDVIAYVRTEFLYDTRFNALNQQTYQVGADIELTERFRIEPYYRFQNDTAVEPAHENRFGLVLKYYR
jgi:uncharacterized protein DUF2490